MFIPEFIIESTGEFVLVANHDLQSDEAVQLSLAFNRARLTEGMKDLPKAIHKGRLIYDIRGQSVSEKSMQFLQSELTAICSIEFKNHG